MRVARAGAVILLLMTTKFIPPTVLEQSSTHLDGTVAARQDALFKIRGETDKLARELSDAQRELDTEQQSLAQLERELSTVLGRYQTSKGEAEEAVLHPLPHLRPIVPRPGDRDR